MEEKPSNEKEKKQMEGRKVERVNWNLKFKYVCKRWVSIWKKKQGEFLLGSSFGSKLHNVLTN